MVGAGGAAEYGLIDALSLDPVAVGSGVVAFDGPVAGWQLG